jgi:hypothetical protein
MSGRLRIVMHPRTRQVATVSYIVLSSCGCKTWSPRDENPGLRFVVPTLSMMRLWKGWGTQLCGKVKSPKNLGCATRNYRMMCGSDKWNKI